MGKIHKGESKSKVWKYFTKIDNAAICKLPTKDNGLNCKEQIPRIGGNTQSMWSHLQCQHKLEYGDAKDLKDNSLAGASTNSSEKKEKPSRKRKISEDDSDDNFETSRVKQELDDDEDKGGVVNEVWVDSNQQNDFYDDNEASSSSSDEPLRRKRSSNSNKSTSTKRINFALSKVLIESNIPFEAIDSKNFIEFVHELKQNPYYKLPRSYDLREKVFAGLSKEMLK